MPCRTFCLGLPTSVLTVAFTTFCAEWIHKTQVASHIGGRRPAGYALGALDYLRDTREGLDALLFCARQEAGLGMLLLRQEPSRDGFSPDLSELTSFATHMDFGVVRSLTVST